MKLMFSILRRWRARRAAVAKTVRDRREEVLAHDYDYGR